MNQSWYADSIEEDWKVNRVHLKTSNHFVIRPTPIRLKLHYAKC